MAKDHEPKLAADLKPYERWRAPGVDGIADPRIHADLGEVILTPREHVVIQERHASGVLQYPVEESTFADVSNSLPTLEGKSFRELVTLLPEEGKILEFGGGPQQRAARDILNNRPQLHYVGYDIRPLTREAQAELENYPKYSFYPEGVSTYSPLKHSDNKFDVAFAHFVAPHIPDAFFLARTMFDSVKPNGAIFINNVVIRHDIASGLMKIWKDLGYSFNFNLRRELDSDLSKAGFALLDFSLLKTSNNLATPTPLSDVVRDQRGRRYPMLQYQLSTTLS